MDSNHDVLRGGATSRIGSDLKMLPFLFSVLRVTCLFSATLCGEAVPTPPLPCLHRAVAAASVTWKTDSLGQSRNSSLFSCHALLHSRDAFRELCCRVVVLLGKHHRVHLGAPGWCSALHARPSSVISWATSCLWCS